jgi:hypothetical protein
MGDEAFRGRSPGRVRSNIMGTVLRIVDWTTTIPILVQVLPYFIRTIFRIRENDAVSSL